MLIRWRRLAPAVVLACLLVGCVPPAPIPSPTPSYRCTPEAGGAEFECSQHQFDEMVAKDKLYAEAEDVYRRFFAEDVRILRLGGLNDPSPVLLETSSGAFLDDSMDYYRSLKKEQTRLVGGEIRLISLARAIGISKGDSVVAMKACIDATTTSMETDGKPAGRGRSGTDVLYFGPAGGPLRIQGADGAEGDSC